MARHRQRHRKGRAVVTVQLAVVLLVLGAVSSMSAPVVTPSLTEPVNPPGLEQQPDDASFVMLTEVYGDGTAVLKERLQRGLASGASLHPVLSPGERAIVGGGGVPFVYFAIPSETGVEACYPESADADSAQTLKGLGVTPSSSAWRLGMPEFDQSGGCWATGRPSPVGQSDAEVYDQWSQYYLDVKGLRPYLEGGAERRGYKWMSLCAFAFCPQYAYDLGSDAVLLERNNDEVSGMSPGLAMIRGAARQHGGREWGVDISTYRYWNGGPTVFDPSGKLVSGWSPSTFERNLFAAYMSGAHILKVEAADYTTGATVDGLNPLGLAVRDFADFSLRRHPQRGTPHVPMAIVQDHLSGFEPRYGEFDQTPNKWYRKRPYTPGDQMLDGLLELAFPGHASWGAIAPAAPWRVTGGDGQVDVPASQAAYRKALADGADPRSWETMSSTRWGESVDVITDRARLETLQRYSVVVLSLSDRGSPELWTDLMEYVRRGGQLVVNADQVPEGGEEFAGVRFTGERHRANAATWTADGSPIAEQPYDYDVAVPESATVVATTSLGHPLVTKRVFGNGTVYVATPDRLLGVEGRGVLNTGVRLLDQLHRDTAKVVVEGAPIQYLINTDGPRTIVTLINTDATGGEWRGTLRFPAPAGPYAVREWTRDTEEAASVRDGQLSAEVTVPGYGVRVFALEPAG